MLFLHMGAERTVLLALAVAVTAGACAPAQPSQPAAKPPASASPTHSGRALSIDGNRLVDGRGSSLRLLGVNRAGTEYACVQGWGIFDGPSDSTSVGEMAAWHINAVRLPLNEDCWLGINGVKPAYSATAYRAAVQQYVSLLHQHGLAVILDLHWAAPRSVPATMQLPMADADHALAFWTSVATAFRSDSDVVFDLYNEPFLTTANAATADPWGCWLNGCSIDPGFGVGEPWRSAGMQALLDAVRGAGAEQPVIAGGLAWSSDLSGWLAHRPHDSAGQLAASFHLYNFSGCNAASCWGDQVAPLAERVPVVTGELGENDCAGGFVDRFMGWADQHGVSYLGWTWDTWNCSSGPALISSYAGTPTPFGAAIRAHLTALAAP